MTIPHESQVRREGPWSASELRSCIWSDTSYFVKRYRKGAAALVAVAKTLGSLQPLPEQDEFLALFERCTAVDSAIFTRLWQEPAAYAWSFRTYDNLGVTATLERRAEQGQEDQREPWRRHRALLARQIEYFKPLALALHALAGESLALESPYCATLPFSLPGTGWVLRGEGTAEIHGVADGAVDVAFGDQRLRLAPGETREGLALDILPRLRHRGCEVVVDPWLCRVPGINFAEGDNALAHPARPDARDLGHLTEALDWLEEFSPEAFPAFRDHMRVFNLKAADAAGVGAVSLTELPGAITFKMCRDSVWLLETYVHEWFHNQLFFLDEETPILAEIPGAAENYSPWRPDPRPPHGLIHAVYVHVPVIRAFLRLHASGRARGRAADYVVHNLVRMRNQMPVAIDVLDRSCDFTEFGRVFFEALRQEVGAVSAEIDAAVLPRGGPARIFDQAASSWQPVLPEEGGAPLTTREWVRDHIRRYDRRGQAAHWIPRI